jgi:ectoine hydroxylase
MTEDRELRAAAGTPWRAEFARQYRRDGYVLIRPPFLPAKTLDTVSSVLPSVLARESPARILERDGVTVRSVYGLHQSEPRIAALARLPVLLDVVRDLLGDDVYVHQSKVNIKAPLAGDQWEWHQDFIYWLHGDGIQKPDLVNVAIFLDEVNEFNGPLTFVPGSHAAGLLAGVTAEGMPLGYEDAPKWAATLTADERFRVDPLVIQNLIRANGLASPQGPAGSVLIFHPNILHCSAANTSPFRRAMLMFVYNDVKNGPRTVAEPRPAFLAEPDIVSVNKKRLEIET